MIRQPGRHRRASARFGTSILADVIRAGVDPHCHTAAMFAGISPEAFLRLKSSKHARKRERFATLRQGAKAINFGIPGAG